MGKFAWAKVSMRGKTYRDPEVKTSKSGNTWGTFSVNIPKGKKKEDGSWENIAQWFDVKAFGQIAEILEQIKKGDELDISGELEQESYEKDGRTTTKSVVIAKSITIIPNDKKPNQAKAPAQVATQYDDGGGYGNDDIPF